MRIRIVRDSNGTHRVYVQRDKFKHWFELGRHRPTDLAFSRALERGAVKLPTNIEQTDTLFKN